MLVKFTQVSALPEYLHVYYWELAWDSCSNWILWKQHFLLVQLKSKFSLHATIVAWCGREWRRCSIKSSWSMSIYCRRASSCVDKPGYTYRMQKALASWMMLWLWVCKLNSLENSLEVNQLHIIHLKFTYFQHSLHTISPSVTPPAVLPTAVPSLVEIPCQLV